MNDIQITMVGNLATDPVLRSVGDGVPVAGFRVASTPRRYDRSTAQWRDGETIFLSVNCWRRLAEHVATSLHKGDGVIVNGRLVARSFDDREQQRRWVIEVEAITVGPDLTRGTAPLVRAQRSTSGAEDVWSTPLGAGAGAGVQEPDAAPGAPLADPFAAELSPAGTVAA